jgi:hypothetical protein
MFQLQYVATGCSVELIHLTVCTVPLAVVCVTEIFYDTVRSDEV